MKRCENCFRRHWRAKINQNTGLQTRHKNGNLVYVCIWCGNVQEEEPGVIPIPERIRANILYIDLETSKSLYYNYGARVPNRYLHPENLVKEWYMMAWSASYLGSDVMWSQVVSSKAAVEWDDSQIIYRLHELLQSADIIAGHNVDGFDLKRCNTRFIKHKLPPIVGKRTLDTLKAAKKVAFESNTLEYISNFYGFGGKDRVTNEDWLLAQKGDKQTLKKILSYNQTDVIKGKSVLSEMLPLFNKSEAYGCKKSIPDVPDMLKKLRKE